MKRKERVEIIKPQGFNCFACGTANPIGLNMEFYLSDGKICTDITLGEYHVGWSNITHGGIISTLLDEVMSWTILYFSRLFFVTRKMEVKYIRPVLIGTPLTICGQLLDHKESSKNIKARADIRDKRRNLLARSTGDFVAVGKEKMSFVSNKAQQEIFSLIENLPPL